ncbi:histidine kinase N-terminal 7TM domain-containing protein [Halosimplex sp. TS25]|uniref:sensor histidine kinase n=1 Tax=Halosimplex rarum TaxID=3396619 RepID=UPI0039EC09C5
MVSESVYLWLVAVSTVVAAAVAVWLWDDDDDGNAPGRLFAWVAALYALTGVFVLGELLATSRELSVALFGAHSATATLVPLAWFLFALAYTGNLRRLSRAAFAAVGGVYVVYAALQVTNPYHRLVWSGYEVTAAPFPHVTAEPATVAFVFFLPQTLVYYGVLGLLGAYLLFGSGVRRTQTAALFVGYLSSFVVLNTWFFGVLPGPLDGALVVGSTWSLALASWAVFRHQLFDLAPLARETVLEILDDAVVVVDSDRRLLDYNRSAAESFPALVGHEGAPIDAVIPRLVATEGDRRGDGGSVADGGTDDAGATDGAGTTSQVTGGAGDRVGPGPFASSFTWFDAESVREFDVTASPLTIRGAVEGHTLVLRDVTERRQHVRDLEQQTTQLEQFASTLSHDLRNPLNVAHGRVQIAREADDDEHLTKASEALERMDQIIQDTLTLAREGETIEERERVDLAVVARDAWETTETGDATLEIDPGVETRVYADATRLQSVFENLYRNAVEHGGPSVTVTVGRTADGFFVADDGPGVLPDERDRVFEYAYSTAEDGTGLGLAIVDAIARAHGWDVAMIDGDPGRRTADGGSKRGEPEERERVGATVVFSGVDLVEGVAEAERERSDDRESGRVDL